MALGGKKDRGCGRADVGTPLTRRMLKGPRLPRVSSRLGPGPSHHVPFFQKIPNSILVSLVQERLNEDDCLRKVRLPGPVWHNAQHHHLWEQRTLLGCRALAPTLSLTLATSFTGI